MAFKTKYKNVFYNALNQKYEFHLQEEDYTGDVNILFAGTDPVKLIDNNQGSDKFKAIRGTELKAQLMPLTDSPSYDIQADLFNITDRKWRGVLKREDGQAYQGEIGITTLDIDGNSIDATATIQILNEGGVGNKPTCLLDLSQLQLPASGQQFDIYALPITQGSYSGDKLILSLGSLYASTVEGVVDTIASEPDWTKINAYTVEYQQSTFDEDIDSSWMLKIGYELNEYEVNTWNRYTMGNRFTGKMTRQFIQIDLCSYQEGASVPKVYNLATREYESFETVNNVASALQSEMDGKEFQNIQILDAGEYTPLDLEIGASVSTDTITITLKNIGVLGNGIQIRSELFPNDTYIKVTKLDGSDYDWTDTNFSGGDAGGDTFSAYLNLTKIAEVKSSATLNTKELIMAAIANKINRLSALVSAEVDASDTSKVIFTTSQDFSGYNYKFTTSGSSATYPATSTSFDSIELLRDIFTGWVKPEIYKQPHRSGRMQLEISVVDGLGDLKNIEFKVNESRPFEKLSLIEIISSALEQTGIKLRISESFDIWEINTSTSSPPLSQIYEDTSRLNGVDCYTVLEEIVTLLKSFLCQHENIWQIIPLDQLSASYDTRRYDFLGRYLEDVTRSNFIKNAGGVTRDCVFLNASALLQMEPGYRKVRYKQNYGYVPQLLKFPTFSTINDNLNNFQYPWAWKYNSIRQSDFGEISLNGDTLYIGDDALHSGNIFYLEQYFRLKRVDVNESGQKQYELEIVYIQDVNGADDFTVKLYVENDAGTVDAYLQEDEEGDVWNASDTTITLVNDKSGNIKRFKIEFDFPKTLFTNRELNGYIQVYQPSHVSNEAPKFISLKSIKINTNTSGVVGQTIEAYYDEKINLLTSKIKDVTINLADVPTIGDAIQTYKNGLFYIDSDDEFQLTENWDTDPTSYYGYGIKLLEHLNKLYLREYNTSVIMLTAEVYGNLGLRDIIKDQSNGDKLFMLTGGEWNVKKAIVSGEWHEYNISDSGLTFRQVNLVYENESSGSNSYSGQPGGSVGTGDTEGGGGGGGEEVDLSNYVQTGDLQAAIEGKEGSFTYSQLVNKKIDIYHNLNRKKVILHLWDKNDREVNRTNFDILEAFANYFTLELRYPGTGIDTFTYRIL